MPVLVSNMQDRLPVEDSLPQLLEQVAETVLKLEKAAPEAEVSIALVDDLYIRELNRQYRHKDCPTDVLSFAMREDTGEEPPVEGEEDDAALLGDVVISMETAERQAVEFGHSFPREVAYLAAHGVLHLLGYDHETDTDREVMRAREEEVLALLNLSR
ncbi:rRNA maturation RNase YbeY [bacterium]|nr:MAG: rRNA maturation RNase YbeY [bacterium]